MKPLPYEYMLPNQESNEIKLVYRELSEDQIKVAKEKLPWLFEKEKTTTEKK